MYTVRALLLGRCRIAEGGWFFAAAGLGIKKLSLSLAFPHIIRGLSFFSACFSLCMSAGLAGFAKHANIVYYTGSRKPVSWAHVFQTSVPLLHSTPSNVLERCVVDGYSTCCRPCRACFSVAGIGHCTLISPSGCQAAELLGLTRLGRRDVSVLLLVKHDYDIADHPAWHLEAKTRTDMNCRRLLQQFLCCLYPTCRT